LVIEDFLDTEEFALWKGVTQDAVDHRLEQTGQGNDETSYYAQVFTQCVKLADTWPAMRELMFDARLGKLAAELAGVDGIRIWHDQALFKPPYGNPTAWHLDNPYWSFSSHHAISIWIALDDATLENGCLWYVPGSHQSARFENVGIGQNIGDLFRVYPEWRSIDPVAAPARAGTAVFHNGLTAHGAGANMTNRPRRSMTCAYMPDGSTYNGIHNILPESYLKTLNVGDVINDDNIVPLIWKQS
jgi:ectoine hydroxylase-related dioxygenase (phytanoyl-CoA dioxygenase family)